MENIDLSKMEVLGEFRYEGEMQDNEIAFRLGVLVDKFIIASQSLRAEDSEANVIPEGISEKARRNYERGIERNWWRGAIFFELKNFNAVLERIEEVYGVRKAKEKKDFNDFDIEAGQDVIAIEKNSVMPNNVAEPIVTLYLTNKREANLDGLELKGWNFYVSPETGLKMIDEMQKIKPEIEKRLNNKRRTVAAII